MEAPRDTARRLLLVSLCLLGARSIVCAGPDGGAEKRSQSLEHWRSLPPEKRERLKRFYETLRELSPEERKHLLERFRTMDEKERRVALEEARKESARDAADGAFENGEVERRELERERRAMIRRQFDKLPPEEKARWGRLAGPDRLRVMREKAQERNEKIISRLPPPLREKAEKLSTREQTAFLLQLRGERLFKKTFQDEAEVARLRAMPHRSVAEALEKGSRKDPPEKPDFIAEGTWKRWLELRPFERPSALRQLLGGAAAREHDPHRRPGGPRPPGSPPPDRSAAPRPPEKSGPSSGATGSGGTGKSAE